MSNTYNCDMLSKSIQFLVILLYVSNLNIFDNASNFSHELKTYFA